MLIKSFRAMLVILWCFFLVRFEGCGGARLLANQLFIDPDSRSAFDPNLNSVVSSAGLVPLKDSTEKQRLPCDEAQIEPWIGSANNANNMLISGDDREKESHQTGEMYSVLPMGGETPSAASHGGNGMLEGQRLSASNHSPGVGHMQVYSTVKSGESGGVGGMQQHEGEGVSKKRSLSSTPSPGGGH